MMAKLRNTVLTLADSSLLVRGNTVRLFVRFHVLPVRASLFVIIATAAFATALSSSAHAQSKPTGVSCKALLPGRPPANAGEKALWAEDWAAAATEYQKLLAAHPNDPAIVAGLTRAYLADWKNSEAAAVVATAHAAESNSSIMLTAAGEVSLRQGNIPMAQRQFVSAVRADPCNAQAHYDVSRIYRLMSMYESAYKQLHVAWQLDPSDPDIRDSWIVTLPVKERIAMIKQWLAQTKQETPDKDHLEMMAYLKHLEDAESGPEHHCHVVGKNNTLTIPMTPHMANGQDVEGWALDMGINGHSTRLLIDTGASGITINHVAADRAGLKAVEKTTFAGIGDQGAVNGYVAYVDSIRIGDVEFADCMVEVSSKRSVGDTAGLVGMNVFQNFMITLDYPLRRFSIKPLPERPGQAGDQALETSSDTSAKTEAPVFHDPYNGPEVKDFFPVFQSGSKLLVEADLNKTPNNLMFLDTGSDSTLFNAVVSPRFVRTVLDNSYSKSIKGVSGAVEHVYTTSFVTMRFSNVQQELQGSFAIDMTSVCRSVDMEVSGLIGASALYQMVIDLDYRDGLARFTYDRKHGSNAW